MSARLRRRFLGRLGRLEVLEKRVQRLVLVLEVNEVLAHLVGLALLLLDIPLEAQVCFARGLGLFEAPLHFLDQLGKLPVLFVLFGEGHREVLVLSLHLRDEGVALLELLFDYLELLRVRKGVLGAHDFFELVAQTGALFHVELDLHLDLGEARAADVPLEALDFLGLRLFVLDQLFDLAFQVDHEVRVRLKGAWRAPSELRLRHPVGGFLLHDEFVNQLVLALQLDLDNLQLGLEPRVLVF